MSLDTRRNVSQDDLNQVKAMAREIMKPKATYHDNQAIFLRGVIASQIDKASAIWDMINKI